MKTLLSLLTILMLSGCGGGRHMVYSGTGTSIGLEIAENPQTQLYQLKFGYNRAEVAIVPTNRSASDKDTNNVAGGAKDSVSVLMELKMAGLFSKSENSGIYQRLAVGRDAVNQPGAAFMFVKDGAGKVSDAAVASINNSFRGISTAVPDNEAAKKPLAQSYGVSDKKAQFDEAAKLLGFKSFSEFVLDPTVTSDAISKMADKLKSLGLIQ